MTKYSKQPGPIGIFDSGYSGLTILHGTHQLLPECDYPYLGNNTRTPYGSRFSDVVYQLTHQAMMKPFELGCQLVILSCNTASAKALHTVQQDDLPNFNPDRRVSGIIHPTAEVVDRLTHPQHVGVLATEETIKSDSYDLEIQKLWGDVKVTGVPCPLWVPIIESNEADGSGADYFVKERIDHIIRLDPGIDTLIFGCTHYSIPTPKILEYVPHGMRIVPQGEYVAKSLQDYFRRHPDMDARCTKNVAVRYYATENPERFKETAHIFLHEQVNVEHVNLE